MSLTRSLGEGYLWVDSLCIVQDDAKSKHSEIASMDRVYGGAVVTMIASSGATVDAGLPGVRPGTLQRRQHVERVQDIQLVNRLPGIMEKVDKSVWNTRAWTYQERILSRRKLFLTDAQCSFKCEHTDIELTEDAQGCVHRLSDDASGPDGKVVVRWFDRSTGDADVAVPYRSVYTVVYSTIVTELTSRKLSYLVDVLNAFQGVAGRLFVLFQDTRQPMFPSWSWAGWVGGVTCEYGGRRTLGDFEVLTTSLIDDAVSRLQSMEQYRGPVTHSWKLINWRGSSFWEYDGKDGFYYTHPLPTLSGDSEYAVATKTVRGHNCLVISASVAKMEVSGREVNGIALLSSAYGEPDKRRRLHALSLCLSDRSWAGTRPRPPVKIITRDIRRMTCNSSNASTLIDIDQAIIYLKSEGATKPMSF
ncbi:hypothetical protein LTR97_012463 [Elasticomyces elasticus]|uniref:Heterokaryon incompatibility domain-containing protein n=1 Tax=Elasticomyces elasticus TaxID=574655 RepID=A0AAN7VVK4_9PEZI|nr:hypothetical protein LTR97_012463 [Elasticomyces elasticus]